MVIFPLAPDQTIAQMWSNGARGGKFYIEGTYYVISRMRNDDSELCLWAHEFWGRISLKLLEIEIWFQRTTDRKLSIYLLSSCRPFASQEWICWRVCLHVLARSRRGCVLTGYSWTLWIPNFSGPQPAAVFISCRSHGSGSAQTIFHQLPPFETLEYASTAMSRWGLTSRKRYRPATRYCSALGLAYLFLVKVPAHHSAPSSAALAEGSRADCIQTISHRVQCAYNGSAPAYWRALSGGRCRGSSATPFQFIFIIDCQPHPTSHCW